MVAIVVFSVLSFASVEVSDIINAANIGTHYVKYTATYEGKKYTKTRFFALSYRKSIVSEIQHITIFRAVFCLLYTKNVFYKETINKIQSSKMCKKTKKQNFSRKL